MHVLSKKKLREFWEVHPNARGPLEGWWRVAELAVRYRLPAVSFVRDFADQGGLLSYGSDEADAYRKAATYADEILKAPRLPACPCSSRPSSNSSSIVRPRMRSASPYRPRCSPKCPSEKHLGS